MSDTIVPKPETLKTWFGRFIAIVAIGALQACSDDPQERCQEAVAVLETNFSKATAEEALKACDLAIREAEMDYGVGSRAQRSAAKAERNAARTLSKFRAAESGVKKLVAAVQMYRLDTYHYPSTAQGLGALMEPPPEVADSWDGPYLDSRVWSDSPLIDPWGTAYVYQFPAENQQGFALYSLGADSLNGGEGINADVGYLPEQ